MFCAPVFNVLLHAIIMGAAVPSFLGALGKLRKGTICFVMFVCPSVRPSVRMEQLGYHWADFN
jgi:hypothetical protein